MVLHLHGRLASPIMWGDDGQVSNYTFDEEWFHESDCGCESCSRINDEVVEVQLSGQGLTDEELALRLQSEESRNSGGAPRRYVATSRVQPSGQGLTDEELALRLQNEEFRRAGIVPHEYLTRFRVQPSSAVRGSQPNVRNQPNEGMRRGNQEMGDRERRAGETQNRSQDNSQPPPWLRQRQEEGHSAPSSTPATSRQQAPYPLPGLGAAATGVPAIHNPVLAPPPTVARQSTLGGYISQYPPAHEFESNFQRLSIAQDHTSVIRGNSGPGYQLSPPSSQQITPQRSIPPYILGHETQPNPQERREQYLTSHTSGGTSTQDGSIGRQSWMSFPPTNPAPTRGSGRPVSRQSSTTNPAPAGGSGRQVSRFFPPTDPGRQIRPPEHSHSPVSPESSNPPQHVQETTPPVRSMIDPRLLDSRLQSATPLSSSYRPPLRRNPYRGPSPPPLPNPPASNNREREATDPRFPLTQYRARSNAVTAHLPSGP
jgi:hypothetical protein